MTKLTKLKHLLRIVRMLAEAKADGHISFDEILTILDAIEDAVQELDK